MPITALQYVQMRDEKADKRYKPTNRERMHFIIGSTHYSVDAWNNIYGQEKTYILRFANPDKVDPNTLIPEFIQAEKNIRDDNKYEMRSIAKIE